MKAGVLMETRGGRALLYLLFGLALAAMVGTLMFSGMNTASAASPVKAYGWGYNEYGQLGTGTLNDRNLPGAMKNLQNVKSVDAGCYHSLALMNNGTVRASGYNQYGELGNGANTDSSVPVAVKNLTNVKMVSAGCYHSMAVTENGSVYAWGYNGYGQLGNGTINDSNVPKKVGDLGKAKGVKAGYYSSTALLTNGKVWSWGYNYYGQLGNGKDFNDYPSNEAYETSPVKTKVVQDITRISNGEYSYHTLALDSKGRVFTWGDGSDGDGTDIYDQDLTPVRVKNLGGAVKGIGANYYYSLFLMKDGTVKSLGYNFYGELGDGTTTDRGEPVRVKNISNVKAISAGGYHGLALLNNGSGRAWGYNNYGELGNGKDSNTNPSDYYEETPVAVKNLSGMKSVSGGYYFSLATK